MCVVGVAQQLKNVTITLVLVGGAIANCGGTQELYHDRYQNEIPEMCDMQIHLFVILSYFVYYHHHSHL